MDSYLNYLLVFIIIIVAFFIIYYNNNMYKSNIYEDTSLFQVSTLKILAGGDYVGHVTVGELKAHGNTGIGTFNFLDGEMVEKNGIIYQIKSNGKIYRPSDDLEVPFAMVTHFKPSHIFKLNNVNYEQFKTKLDPYFKYEDSFCTIQVEGTFNFVKLRSVPSQKEISHPLPEVIEHQNIFYKKNVTGTLIGFWCPTNYSSINQIGFHLHLISADEKHGGHVLDFNLNEGIVEFDEIKTVQVVSKDK